jgi:hypothetical protein
MRHTKMTYKGGFPKIERTILDNYLRDANAKGRASAARGTGMLRN